MHTSERQSTMQLGGTVTTRDRRTPPRGANRGARPRLAPTAVRRTTGRVVLVVLAALGVLACGTPPSAPLPLVDQGGVVTRVADAPTARLAATVGGDTAVVPPDAPGDSIRPDGNVHIRWRMR